MDGGGHGNLVIKKRFASEAELVERRERRQEEWEKVRKPEDPKGCPEEVHDPQSRYERLQGQKDRQRQECAEQFKFKNTVRSLGGDEIIVLEEVSWQQELIEKRQREEELKERKDYRSHLHKVGAAPDHKKEVDSEVAVKPMETKHAFSQAKLLVGVVTQESAESGTSVKRLQSVPDGPDDRNPGAPSCVSLGSTCLSSPSIHWPSAAVCIGILPGLGAYSGSSDSESSSDSEGTIDATEKIISSIFRTNTFPEDP